MGWNHNDLTVAAGAPSAIGPLCAYMFDTQGTQHVFYTGLAPAHIHELWWRPGPECVEHTAER